MKFHCILAIAFLICHLGHAELSKEVKELIHVGIQNWQRDVIERSGKQPNTEDGVIEEVRNCIQKSSNWLKVVWHLNVVGNENCCAVEVFRACIEGKYRKNLGREANEIADILMEWPNRITPEPCPEVTHGYWRCIYQEYKLIINIAVVVCFLVGVCCIVCLCKCYCRLLQRARQIDQHLADRLSSPRNQPNNAGLANSHF